MIKAKNLVKRYGELLALDTLNLEIKKGSIFGLLGPNGAGKTTFINCLIGMTDYQNGEITIDNMTMKKEGMTIKKRLGIVPQNLAIYMDQSAYDNVTYFGSLYGLSGSTLKNAAKEALEFVDLWDRRKDKPKKYSGGMKRRLNIACALVHKPDIVIMDEPTVGIDPQSRNHILESVRKLNEEGATVIYTSHYMEEVEAVCDTIGIVDHGKLIAEGTHEDLRKYIQKDRIIEIKTSGATYTVVEELKQLFGVKECFLKDGMLTLVLDQNVDNLDKVVTAVMNADVKILSIDMKQASLEDVFLALTGRKLRD